MKNKAISIMVSAAIAVTLWIYVITTVSPESEETFYDIPVTFQNDILEERGLMIVSETPTVDLKLKGNRSDLNELNATNISLLVNLAGIQAPGSQMVNYDIKFPGNIPDNPIEVLSQSPNVLQLKVENKIKKAVPIKLDFMDTKVPEGYIADKDNPVVDVATVEVVGPESVVQSIDHALVQLDLSEKVDSIIGQFEYVLCDAQGDPVDAVLITTNVENINLSLKIQRIKEVPLVLNVSDGGGASAADCVVELSRETVWVSGSENKLRDLESVELGTVDLGQLHNESNTLEFDIVLPEGVTNMTGDAKVSATITFPKLAKKKVSVSMERFSHTGVPAGATVTWITQVLEVELRGPKDQINRITEKDLTVTMDFTNEELGSVSKVPKVTISGSYPDVGAVTVPAITATVQIPTIDTMEAATDAAAG